MKNKRTKLSRSFQRWLLAVVAIAFLATTAFLWLIQTRLSQNNAISLLELNLSDVVYDSKGEADETFAKLSGAIEMKNVTFGYSRLAEPLLRDFNLTLKPGSRVAFVGTSGCGKSTLMRILLGFEKPQKGAVYYNGKDLNTIDLKFLRRKIGVVMQNGKLFQGDIYSNIVISAPQLTLDQAWEAAEMAGIAEDIRRMPMGMHTLISEGSGGISGGQRQRLDA